jgi:hypothetical protein
LFVVDHADRSNKRFEGTLFCERCRGTNPGEERQLFLPEAKIIASRVSFRLGLGGIANNTRRFHLGSRFGFMLSYIVFSHKPSSRRVPRSRWMRKHCLTFFQPLPKRHPYTLSAMMLKLADQRGSIAGFPEHSDNPANTNAYLGWTRISLGEKGLMRVVCPYSLTPINTL